MNDKQLQYKNSIEKQLEYVLENCGAEGSLLQAMKYSLLDAGKRVRPMLLLEFARLCSDDWESALNAACAVECIHTYSLIHDDLPCMDNDDMRRGKPSCHKKFGEDIALLAGDALLTLAFELITKGSPSDSAKTRAAEYLARMAGGFGMVGGQVIDLESEGKSIDIDTLRKLIYGKTCALIKSACVLGCVIAGGSEEQIKSADNYAYNVGMAFQIIDDILDVISDEQTLGKPINSDKENNKSTYVTLLGMEKAREDAHSFTVEACKCLSVFGSEAQFLIDFALALENRLS